MIRAIAIGVIVLSYFAVAACKGDDDTSTATPTAIASTISSAPASATSTTAASPAPTSDATPGGGLSGEPWTVSGQLSGTAQMTEVTCDIVQDSYQVNVAGTLDGKYFAVRPVFSTTTDGGINYGADSPLFIEVLFGTTTADQFHWNNGSGVEGSGNLSADPTGSGNLNVTVPASLNSPGFATAPITVAGFWTCP